MPRRRRSASSSPDPCSGLNYRRSVFCDCCVMDNPSILVSFFQPASVSIIDSHLARDDTAMNTPVKAEESSAVSHTEEMTQILSSLTALKRGDASARLPYHGSGVFAKVAEVF